MTAVAPNKRFATDLFIFITEVAENDIHRSFEALMTTSEVQAKFNRQRVQTTFVRQSVRKVYYSYEVEVWLLFHANSTLVFQLTLKRI